jgi:osmoprotectant transport system permease protein
MKRVLAPFLLLAGLVGVTVWMTGLETVGIYRMPGGREVAIATFHHLQLVLAAEALAILIGVPIGFIVSRPAFRWLGTPLMALVNIGQTIPTLALLAIASLAIGSGFRAAVVGLFVYALLPIVRNTYAGIRSVDPAVKEAAQGMGMTRVQVTSRVELPLARPVIVAGIRTSTVVNVGTAAVAGMIGGVGLGSLITTGLAVNVVEMILQGAAPAAALAIALDALLGMIERWMTPRGLRSTAGGETTNQRRIRRALRSTGA